MVANERLVADDGYEVMLFPLPYMYISQGEGESYSHAGTLNIDFLGYNANGRVYQAPLYAPCSCKCVGIIGGTPNPNGRVFQSNNLVHTPNGLQYVTFLTFHDDNPIATLNMNFIQGQLIGHTGTAGDVSGDHIHLNTANGIYDGYEYVPPDNELQLKNSTHIYNICYVNDTVLVEDYNYNWINYSGGHAPIIYPRSRFPWILYARKLRNKSQK